MKRKSKFNMFKSDRYIHEGEFYEKGKGFVEGFAGCILFFVLLVLFFAFVVCLDGCATNRTRRNAGDVRLTDSYIAGSLESAVSDFDGGIGRTIRESRGIADEVDRLEFLFNRYEQHALRLRDEVDSLRRQIEGSGQDNLGGGDSHSD